MKTLSLPLALLGTLFSYSAAAQATDTTYYFDKDWKACTKENAVKYRTVSLAKDRSGYYAFSWHTADGHTTEKGTSLTADGRTPIGLHTSYYKNGNRDKEGLYKVTSWNEKNTAQSGRWTFWYEDGTKFIEKDFEEDTAKKAIKEYLINHWDTLGIQQVTDGNGSYFYAWQETKPDTAYFTLKGKVKNKLNDGEWLCAKNGMYVYYREQYADGNLISGVSYDDRGKKYAYTEIEVPAQFPGGDAALLAFLRNNISYPTEERDNDIQGKIMTRFYVDKDGSVKDVNIVRGGSPGLDREAYRVVKALPNFSPGMQRGQPVKVYFTLPVIFKLQ